MKTTLQTEITIKIFAKALFTTNSKAKAYLDFRTLTIQPEYQRNYIYADGKRCCRY